MEISTLAKLWAGLHAGPVHVLKRAVSEYVGTPGSFVRVTNQEYLFDLLNISSVQIAK